MDKGLADESLRNHLRTRPPRRDLDRLARLLQAVALDELPLDQALSRFDARAREEAAAWFAKHPDTPASAFYLALMVYNGCRYQTVLDASTDLEPRLDAASGVREPDPTTGLRRTPDRASGGIGGADPPGQPGTYRCSARRRWSWSRSAIRRCRRPRSTWSGTSTIGLGAPCWSGYGRSEVGKTSTCAPVRRRRWAS